MLAAPVLAGVTLRKPQRFTPSTELVQETVQLAGGGLRRYVRGYRPTFNLEWEKLPEVDALAIVAACSGQGALLFTPPGSASSVWVFLDAYPDPVPVPGTDPERYDVSVTLTGRDVR